MAPAAATYRARAPPVLANGGYATCSESPTSRSSRSPRSTSSRASTPPLGAPAGRRRATRRTPGARSATAQGRGCARFTSSPSTASAMAALSALLTPPPRASPDHPGASSSRATRRSALRSTFCASRRPHQDLRRVWSSARVRMLPPGGARRGPRGGDASASPSWSPFGFPLVRSRADAHVPAPSPLSPRAPLQKLGSRERERELTGHVRRGRPGAPAVGPVRAARLVRIDALDRSSARRAPAPSVCGGGRRGRRGDAMAAARRRPNAPGDVTKVNKEGGTATFLVHRWRRAPCSAACWRRGRGRAHESRRRRLSRRLSLQAIKVDDRGRVWRVRGSRRSGELLKHRHVRDRPLLFRGAGVRSTPATMSIDVAGLLLVGSSPSPR